MLTGGTIEETMEWLQASGINTSRLMSPEMEDIAEENLMRRMEYLGIPYEK